MSLIRFSKVLNFKYNLLSTAAPPVVPGSQHSYSLEDAIAIIQECYYNYCSPSNDLNNQYRSFRELALRVDQHSDTNESLYPFLREIFNAIKKLYVESKVPNVTAAQLFAGSNYVLELIRKIQNNPGVFDDMIRKEISLGRTSDKDDREQSIAKNKKILFAIIAAMLFKVATITKKLSGTTEEIKGGPTDAGITELTALNKRKFVNTPEASALGLRDLEVFEKAWGYPDVQPLLHKYINTILSGKTGSNSIKFRLCITNIYQVSRSIFIRNYFISCLLSRIYNCGFIFSCAL